MYGIAHSQVGNAQRRNSRALRVKSAESSVWIFTDRTSEDLTLEYLESDSRSNLFVPSGDNTRDAMFLSGVESGIRNRFYVSIVDAIGVGAAGGYVVLCDWYNDEVLSQIPFSYGEDGTQLIEKIRCFAQKHKADIVVSTDDVVDSRAASVVKLLEA